MFQKIAKHRANDASNDVHRPPLFCIALSPCARRLSSPVWLCISSPVTLSAFHFIVNEKQEVSECGLLFAHSLRARGQDTAKSHSSKSNQVMNNMWTIQFQRVFNEGILQYSVPIVAPNLCYFFLTFYPLHKKQK